MARSVNFTDGNLQYMMPKQVYSLTVRKHIDSNTLYRKGKDQPLALEAKYNVLKDTTDSPPSSGS